MHSNGPEGQKCHNPHGHDWLVEVEVGGYVILDEWGWGPPFGAIKDIIREYDHGVGGTLNEMLAPRPPSAEVFAQVLHQRIIAEVLTARNYGGFYLTVTVHEGEGNQVAYT